MSESALRPEALTTLDEMNSVDYEIQHFADTNTLVIGPKSKLGVNRVWTTTENHAREEQPPTDFGMRKYMQMRDWLSTMNIILPHPQQHLGARLLGHNEYIRTDIQCCGVVLQLWRARDLKTLHYPDDGWESLTRLRRHRKGPCEPAEFLFNELKFEDIGGEEKSTSRIRAGRLTWEQAGVNGGSSRRLKLHPLIKQMSYSNQQALEFFQWEKPRDEIELRIVEAAFLFFIYAKSVVDDALSNKIWEIIISQHSIMYCDPKLPGHKFTFAQGCELKGQYPTASASTEQVETSVVFDFSKSIGHWRHVIKHLGYCFIP